MAASQVLPTSSIPMRTMTTFWPADSIDPGNSRCMHACGYIVVALVSLTVGLVFSQLFRLEREIKGYPGMLLGNAKSEKHPY